MAKDTRHRIARAALEVFVAHGFDAATTRQIAAAAGLSEGAIYRHFKSKDEIGGELFLTIHRSLTDMIDGIIDERKPFQEALTLLVERYCALADDDWMLFSFHLLQMHRFLHLWQDDGGDPVTSIAKLIRIGMAQGKVPTGNAELLAGMALGVIVQVAQNKAYGRTKATMSSLSEPFKVAISAVLTAR